MKLPVKQPFQNFASTFIIFFVIITLVSLLLPQVESTSSNTHTSCKSYFCSEPYDVTTNSASEIRGVGQPIIAIVTSTRISNNGHEIKSNDISVRWLGALIDTALITLVSLLLSWFVFKRSIWIAKSRKRGR